VTRYVAFVIWCSKDTVLPIEGLAFRARRFAKSLNGQPIMSYGVHKPCNLLQNWVYNHCRCNMSFDSNGFMSREQRDLR